MTDRDRLICENTGLVHACVRKFVGKGAEYDDLYSCGCVGLIKAADKFDDKLGFRFSTYAVPVILGEIKQFFRDSGSVKVSRSLKELSLKASRAIEEYELRFMREPSIGELADILGISVEEASQALDASRLPLSLSLNFDEDNGETDVAVESDEETITERITLFDVIEDLPENDRELIRLRYFKNMTQTQTAERLGMTQVQVSRREKKLLLSLREKLTV